MYGMIFLSLGGASYLIFYLMRAFPQKSCNRKKVTFPGRQEEIYKVL